MKEDAIGQGPNNADYTYADKPVVFVSFFDAMRFANWLHNGRPNSGFQNVITTEAGVYDINNGLTEPRAANAKFWIPSEDEWYKAAFYDTTTGAGGGDNYWTYPTRSDAAPVVAVADNTGLIINPGPNVANYNLGADWNGVNGNVTTDYV